jgi:hypothetical protein
MRPQPDDVYKHFQKYEGLDPHPLAPGGELGVALREVYLKLRERALESGRLTPEDDRDALRRLSNDWPKQTFATRAMLAVMVVSLEIGVGKDSLRPERAT